MVFSFEIVLCSLPFPYLVFHLIRIWAGHKKLSSKDEPKDIALSSNLVFHLIRKTRFAFDAISKIFIPLQILVTKYYQGADTQVCSMKMSFLHIAKQ